MFWTASVCIELLWMALLCPPPISVESLCVGAFSQGRSCKGIVGPRSSRTECEGIAINGYGL